MTPTVAVVCTLIISLFTPILFNAQTIYGYPSAIGQAVPARWNSLNFSVCIFNIADTKYEQLFIKAMEEWKGVWPHFNYNLAKDQSCNINVTITKDFVELTKAGHAGITNTSYYQDGNIEKADIIVPTQIKAEVRQGYYCCREVILEFPEKTFYLTAMHEFGHALNLGHAVDDDKDPRDVMHPAVSEESQYVISALTVNALDKIYGTTTQAKDHPINLKPSVTLEATLDKSSYVFDDHLTISGKVSKIGGTGTILLFDPSVSLYEFASFAPNHDDGTFNVAVDLVTNNSGRWLLAVQYMGASKFFAFNVTQIAYKAYGQTEKATYAIGDLVKVSGNVTRPGKQVSLTVINPDGINIASLIAPISLDKKFSAEFTLKESRYAIEGKWSIKFEYADAKVYADSATYTYFDVVKTKASSPSPVPQPKEEQQKEEVKANLELRVQAKQIRDLIILRVRNMDDSAVGVYAFNISIEDSMFTASRGPKGWDKAIGSVNTVIFSTSTDPIQPGEKQYFLLRSNADVKPVIGWEAININGKTLVKGSVTPLR